ncbi:MAG TPA: type II toxin-antitoxin system VapC family toxin [Solirubrobacteraceae bacterium]|nr:type II toxin-antitoxin system VapC family toxin [Solirubrobacteraceae bacterium]
MTVIDTSGVIDFLLGTGVAEQVETLMADEGELAAPDLLAFEVLAVLRRETLRGTVAESRAASAAGDLGDLPIELFPSLPLRQRAWALRRNLTAADALFVALAEQLEEPLATKDGALIAEAAKHASLTVLEFTQTM